MGDIGYQTNLLALNAAIEAVAEGRGSAVIAGQVRNLAEQMELAAQQIGDSDKQSVAVAGNAVALLDRTVPDGQGSISWTTIAVAGAVAEARADANRRFSRDERLVITDQLVKEVERYVDAVPLAARKRRRIKPLQLTFRTSEGNEGVGSMSAEDVDRMPRQYRDQSSLRPVLEEAARVCDDPGQWCFIEALAKAVLNWPDGILGRTQIEKILGLG